MHHQKIEVFCKSIPLSAQSSIVFAGRGSNICHSKMPFQCPNFVLWTTLREGDMQNGYIRGLQFPACSRWRDFSFPATLCFQYRTANMKIKIKIKMMMMMMMMMMMLLMMLLKPAIFYMVFTSPPKKSLIGPPLMPMLSTEETLWSHPRVALIAFDFWLVKENFKGKRFEDYILPGETSNKNMEDFLEKIWKDVEILKKLGSRLQGSSNIAESGESHLVLDGYLPSKKFGDFPWKGGNLVGGVSFPQPIWNNIFAVKLDHVLQGSR